MLRKGSSNCNCCIVGCGNTYKNSPSLKFYAFPSKPWLEEKKRQWIQAVRRTQKDGSPWQPTKYSKICSAHFVGGEKSENPNSPAYYPSIFPQVYKKRELSEEVAKRHQRTKKRRKLAEPSLSKNCNMRICDTAEVSLSLEPVEPVVSKKVDAECQVFLDHREADGDCFVFSCHHVDENTASTQASIPPHLSFQSYKRHTSSETQTAEGLFEGYESIKNVEQLTDLTGTNFSVFNSLLSILSIRKNTKLSQKNRLLLFLIKMKLGVTFAALACFFCIHRTSCARIFHNVLHELACKTKNYVFWPNKHTVQNLMPECFKAHYPNTRVIIDCTEVRTETPPTAEQRVFMYSQYKHSFTIKFLVAINPNGFICYKSDCYGGRATDAFIVNDSLFLKLLEPGDEVMADKGFPIITSKANVVTVIPPFLEHGRFTKEEVEETYNIASVRIHVERAIMRIKIYGILKKIPVELFPYIDEIVHMCCVLANFQTPIIQKKKKK